MRKMIACLIVTLVLTLPLAQACASVPVTDRVVPASAYTSGQAPDGDDIPDPTEGPSQLESGIGQPSPASTAATAAMATATAASKNDWRPRAFADPVFSRKDLIYGSEIGSWQFDGAYDGYPLLRNPTCKQLSEVAGIPVYRWLPWQRFFDMGGDMPVAQFERIVTGIRDTGALMLIKLPPGVTHQCAPEADLDWLKQIVKRAGDRVRLYEFGNEPNYYCYWSASHYAREWIRVVPALKRYARSLGFEIQVGGPSWSNPNEEAMSKFVRAVKQEFDRTGDEDLIPSFLSFHVYGSLSRGESDAKILGRIPGYGHFIDLVRDDTESTFGFSIPVAVTEWNFSVDTEDRRDRESKFITAYTTDMLREFREHNLWLANQFLFASGATNLDMVDEDCRPKPMFDAFVARKSSDPD